MLGDLDFLVSISENDRCPNPRFRNFTDSEMRHFIEVGLTNYSYIYINLRLLFKGKVCCIHSMNLKKNVFGQFKYSFLMD